MTHQNHQTNGASLEDCHTNFFALVSHFYIDERTLSYVLFFRNHSNFGDTYYYALLFKCCVARFVLYEVKSMKFSSRSELSL